MSSERLIVSLYAIPFHDKNNAACRRPSFRPSRCAARADEDRRRVKQVEVLGDEVEPSGRRPRRRPGLLDPRAERVGHLRDRGGAAAARSAGEGEVVAVTVGDEEAEAALRRCLAMGADRAVRVDDEPLDPFSVARALAGVVAAEAPDLVLCGAQSSRRGQAPTASALAGLLGLPRVAVVTRVRYGCGRPRRRRARARGRADRAARVDLPALLTIQTGINEPRYAKLRAIKQASGGDRWSRPRTAAMPALRARRCSRRRARDGGGADRRRARRDRRRIATIVKERLA